MALPGPRTEVSLRQNPVPVFQFATASDCGRIFAFGGSASGYTDLVQAYDVGGAVVLDAIRSLHRPPPPPDPPLGRGGAWRSVTPCDVNCPPRHELGSCPTGRFLIQVLVINRAGAVSRSPWPHRRLAPVRDSIRRRRREYAAA